MFTNKYPGKIFYYVNDLLTLQICELKLKPCEKRASIGYLLLREIFVLINFCEAPKNRFSRIFDFVSQLKIFISHTLISANNFAKMAKFVNFVMISMPEHFSIQDT